MGSRRDCTWILGLAGFRVITVESDGESSDSRVTESDLDQHNVARFVDGRQSAPTRRTPTA